MNQSRTNSRTVVTRQELSDLYARLKGAPYANTLIDAQSAFEQKDYAGTLQCVRSGLQLYRNHHLRTLRKEPASAGSKHDTERLLRKQEKITKTLQVFQGVVDGLEQMAKRWPQSSSPASASEIEPDKSPEPLDLPTGFRQAFESTTDCDAQFEVLKRFFDIRPVSSGHCILSDTLYYLRGKQRAYLFRCRSDGLSEPEISIRQALSGEPLKSLTRSQFDEQGERGRLVWLASKGASDARATSEPLLGEPVDVEVAEVDTQARDQVLDVGAFSQLLDAAKRSQLVPNADLIAHVRDREFRKGQYQKACQMIESLFGKFSAAASQRRAKLMREDQDIAAGRLRMSPRELQQKRARDIRENQAVDRARNRFQRVLEGLRVLMNE